MRRRFASRSFVCWHRRHVGLSLPTFLAAEALAAQTGRTSPKAKSVIFLLLFGGPSQLETFDMKPEAPEKIRGPSDLSARAHPD